MRFTLQTLLLAASFGPPLLAIAWLERDWALEQNWTFHFSSGVAAVVLYPIAVLMLATVAKNSEWPPTSGRRTWLEIVAFLMAVLAAGAAVAYIASGVREP